jgi:hypothetical protein
MQPLSIEPVTSLYICRVTFYCVIKYTIIDHSGGRDRLHNLSENNKLYM